jgi:hypothetical protein
MPIICISPTNNLKHSSPKVEGSIYAPMQKGPMRPNKMVVEHGPELAFEDSGSDGLYVAKMRQMDVSNQTSPMPIDGKVKPKEN